ncbi:hypothetical protein BAOM_3019 [Peribacillus asahii]|uniref:Uncharacterized protein n=1 Tax=Peribacillus asahii TaxID=228899 RepID=A0A3Q9RPA6_9BACI|nr:hypothetical protein [Peribacillus asahii]AZV43628.1 hypothetical protein BAOM_3019 [Peribacillus asahii]
MLNDLYGWYKRNLNNWTTYNKRKAKDELLAIVKLIDEDLNKGKGGVKNASC